MPAGEERDHRQWLVEPLGANEVRIHVDVGDGVRMSEEARAALDRFLDEVQAAEVEGYSFPRCPELKACSNFICNLGKCAPLTKYPCFADVTCAITKLV